MSKINRLVSVIMPVYNGEKYLVEAIETILQQTYCAIEIIIVDDGSTDSSKEIISNYPQINYLYQQNQGVAVARNTGIEVAKGEYIALLDQDDLWAENKIQIQVDYLDTHPEIDYVIAQQQSFVEEGCIKPKWLDAELLEKHTPAYLVGALLARKSVFETIGGFDSNYRYGNDSDWFAKTIDLGLKSKILPEVVLYKRIHDDNESHNVRDMNAELLTVLRKSILRKRQQKNK